MQALCRHNAVILPSFQILIFYPWQNQGMLFEIQVPKQDAAEITPSGGLIFDAFGTSVGVYQYTLADGRIVYEYKCLDEVAKPESLALIAGAYLCVYHPPEFLNSSNWRTWTMGAFLTPGVMEGRRVKTRGIIYDQATIERVLAGELTEISMGYWQKPVAATGSFEGQAYEIMQTNIMYNHGALYEPGGGRLGPNVGVSLDGKEWRQHAPRTNSQRIDSKPKEKSTMIYDFGGVKVDIPDAQKAQADQALQLFQSKDSQIQTLTQTRNTLQTQLTTIQSLQSQKSAEQDAAQRLAEIEAAGVARAELMDSAKGFLPDNYEFKGKTDTQIRRDALETMGVKGLPATATDADIKTSFDTALLFAPKSNADAGTSPAQQLLSQIGGQQGRTDGAQGGQPPAGYVPPHLRADGAPKQDALVELERLNSHFNNPRNYAGAAGGAK